MNALWVTRSLQYNSKSCEFMRLAYVAFNRTEATLIFLVDIQFNSASTCWISSVPHSPHGAILDRHYVAADEVEES